MRMKTTPIIEKHGRWYIAYVREIPGVITQGRSLAEVRRNLKEALALVIEARQELAGKPIRKRE